MALWKFIGIPLTLLASQASAQASLGGLTLGTWDGSVEMDSGYSQDRSSSEGAASTVNQRNHLYQLNLQNTGIYILDPNLVTATAGITLGRASDTSNAGGITTPVNNGVLGHSFIAEFMNDLPYGGGVFSNLSTSNTVQPFGQQQHTTSNRGITMRLNEGSPLKDMGLPYLSANLRMEKQDLDQLSTSALNQNYHFIEHRKSVNLDGHKGAESSDLNWRYSLNDVSQPLNLKGDNLNKSLGVDYSADFGELLNRRWDSRINYSDTTGTDNNISMLNINEVLQIVHQNNLSTNYNYQYDKVVFQGVPSTTKIGAVSAQYQPYANLSTGASIQHQDLPSGNVDAATVGLGYQYMHELPRNGVLRFNTSGSYGQTKVQSIAATGHVTYEGKTFTFDSAAVKQEVTLNQNYVNVASVQVYAVNSKLSVTEATLMPCPGSVLPTIGSCDYVIETPLGNKTTIQINPLSTTLNGLASAVDALAVSYDYEIPPNLAYATTTTSTSLTLDYGWIAYSLSHNESDVQLLEGDESYTRFLQNTREDRAQMYMQGLWNGIRGNGGAAYSISNNAQIVFSQEHLYGTANYPYSERLTFDFNVDRLITQYQSPERSNKMDSVRLSALWYPMFDTTVNASIGRHSMEDSMQASEIVTDASIRGQMKFGKMMLHCYLTSNARARGGSEINSWRLDLGLVRSL